MGLEAGALDPLTPEECETLKTAFRDRLGDGIEIPVAGSVDLSKTHFSHTVVWEKCVFAAYARFTSTHFARSADFSSTHFARDAWFTSTHFAAYARFTSTHFARDAWFTSTHFARSADFSSTHFARSADFSSTHFADYARFTSTHFADYARFTSTHFAGSARFTSTHFARDAWFTSTHFADYARFTSTHFAGSARFSSTHFAAYAGFENGAFEARTDFEQARFAGRVPSFFQRAMHDNTIFTTRRDLWPEVDHEDAATDKDAYRRLRQISAAQHNPENEHFFLRQEMAYDAVLKEDWLSRWIVRGFGIVSDYGYSVWRPVVALASVVVTFWLFVGLLIARGDDFGPVPESSAEALGLSIANTFAFLGIRSLYFGSEYVEHLHWGFKVAGGFQTALGIVLLFFLGLGLRNRFRLR